MIVFIVLVDIIFESIFNFNSLGFKNPNGNRIV